MGFTIFALMKKRILSFTLIGWCALMSAQFTVKVDMPQNFPANSAFLYSYNGSQEMIAANGKKEENNWVFNVSQPYSGVLKAYFPENNQAFMLISENSNVEAQPVVTDGKISDVNFMDKANQVFKTNQDLSSKQQTILPVLIQMQSFYAPTSEFGSAIKKEVARLSAATQADMSQYPFTQFFTGKLKRYVDNQNGLTKEDYIKFISGAPEYLESSGEIRQVLVNYLRLSSKDAYSQDIDKLLADLDPESPRGQMVLSEFIDIFDVYGMKTLQDKYLAEAKGMKCTVSERLTAAIQNSERNAVGAVMQNYVFAGKPFHTTAKTLYDVKSPMKLIMFWSSTCPHCEAELPKMIENYQFLKSKGVEIVGLSVDEDAKSYNDRASALPWINDSELKGWDSSITDKYNVHATPTYFLLDAKNRIIAKPNNFDEALAVIKKS